MLSADDMRYFLAVARTGRLTLAAGQLLVDHTTVGRRVVALERALGHRLFDRTPTGWVLTEPGQRLVGSAEASERGVLDAREMGDRGQSKLSGAVRIVCPDGFGAFLLAPALGGLLEQNPGLSIEMVTATARLEQTIRDFDLAVTLYEPQSSKVIKRRLGDYMIKMYASRDYLERHGAVASVEDLTRHTLIWYVDRLLDVQPLHQLDEVLARPADMQSTNVVAHWQAAAAGIGVAPLPQYVAERDPQLVQILPEVAVRQTYWLVVPRQHARLSRVQVMVDLLEQIARDRAADMGAAG